MHGAVVVVLPTLKSFRHCTSNVL